MTIPAMSTPRVSVLMAVRDGMPYLAETIDSLVDQTLTDWELIAVDNASTDGSSAYLESRAAADRRILVLHNEGDLSIAGGLNRGLALCRAAWVARIDADDRALPERLARQLAFVADQPELVATSCLAYYIGASGDRIGVTHSDLTTPAAFRRHLAQNEPIILLHPGAMVRRDALLAAGGYRSAFVPAEDIDLWGRLSECGLILVQPARLMEYRVHPGATMSRQPGLARMKQEWAVACMVARRQGRVEPAWDAFEKQWQGASLWQRLHRGRRMLAERLCRTAREDLAVGRRPAGLAKLAIAAGLRPAYTAPRLLAHLPHALKLALQP